MRTQSEIWIKTSFIGFHKWPEAPQTVNYLRALHRHLFQVVVQVPLEGDRVVEFHMLKTWVDESLATLPLRLEDNSTWSCERIADLLCHAIINTWAFPWVKVSISEDGECGAIALVGKGYEE